MKKLLTFFFGRYKLIPINDALELRAIIRACIKRLELIRVSDKKLFDAVEKNEVLNLLREGNKILNE